MPRTISAAGEAGIVQWEGEVLHAHDDFDPTHKLIRPGDRVRGTPTMALVTPGLT